MAMISFSPFSPYELDVNVLLSIPSKLPSRNSNKISAGNAKFSRDLKMMSRFNRGKAEILNWAHRLTPHSIYQKKPYSAVTVSVESLTSEQYEEDDFSGIPDLVEAIKLQATGPAEAARAIRKKLKYGSVHRQLRALTILDGLIQNAGSRFQRTFADEMLLERLRVCGTSDLSDPLVRNKCKELFRSWAAEYKNTRGLERIAALYKVFRPNNLGCQSLILVRNFLVASRWSLKTSLRYFVRPNKIPSRMTKMKFLHQLRRDQLIPAIPHSLKPNQAGVRVLSSVHRRQ